MTTKTKRKSVYRYNVWLEIERHDVTNDSYENLDGLDIGAALARFTSEKNAVAFAKRVQKENQQ